MNFIRKVQHVQRKSLWDREAESKAGEKVCCVLTSNISSVVFWVTGAGTNNVVQRIRRHTWSFLSLTYAGCTSQHNFMSKKYFVQAINNYWDILNSVRYF